MAKLLGAISAYGPKVELKPTAGLEKIAEWMAMRTGLNASEVEMMLREMYEAILYFNLDGTPVKLPGIGTFTPSVDRHGQFKINFRPDVRLKQGINATGKFTGPVRNKERVKLDNAGYKALWDKDHPNDPLEI